MPANWVNIYIITKKNRFHSQRMEAILILYKTVLTCSTAHALPQPRDVRHPLQGSQ